MHHFLLLLLLIPSTLYKQYFELPDENYIRCKKEEVYPIVKRLLQEGRSGEVLDEDPLATGEMQVVTWKEKTTSQMQNHSHSSGNAVSYTLSGGRLGDNLLAFLHAKWIAMKYGLPLVPQPFLHSQYFAFHHQVPKMEFDEHVTVFSESDLDLSKKNTLFIIPYFPQSILDFATVGAWALPYFKPDLEDPVFKEAIRAALKPQVEIPPLPIPEERIKVAVHLRRGGSHEGFLSNSTLYPLKFPPDSYYLEQIKAVYELFDRQPLYIHFFTDAYNQRGLLRKYERWLQTLDVTFGYSKEQDMFQDFYAIGQFDVLIRSTSNFSYIGALLNDLLLNIAPLHAIIEGSEVTIDRLDIVFKNRGDYSF